MSEQELVTLSHNLLPGFGVFGHTQAFRKSLEINAKLDRIDLFFDAEEVQKYRFPAIYLFDRKGRGLPLAKVVRSVVARATGGTEDSEALTGLLLSRAAIVSQSEARPGLTIRFKHPVYLSRLGLSQNGNHQLISRARHLCVNGYLRDQPVIKHNNDDPKDRAAALRTIHQALNIPIPDGPLNVAERQAHCKRVRKTLLTQLDRDRDAFDWNALEFAQFLPLSARDPSLTPFRQRILAEVIICALGEDLSIKSAGFRLLARLLSTPERLETVLAGVNRLLSTRLNRPVQVLASKHRFQEPAMIRHKDSFLEALDKVFPALTACGVTPMLCYGPLLGAVRSNAFIPHDDDVDVLYFDGARSREEAIANAEKLIKALAGHGFEGRYRSQFDADANTGVHFGLQYKNSTLDIFPCWQDDDNLYVMMGGSRKYCPVPKSVMLPTSSVRLHDHVYPAPADPVAFLADRYGAGWGVSDPYYEWPWPLEMTGSKT